MDDLGWFHIPIRHLYGQALRQGESFLWSSALFSGLYIHGEGQAGMLHPLHVLLYRFLSLHTAMGLEVLCSYLIGFSGMWVLLRRLQFGQAARAFGAIVFTFSGFNLLHLNHVNAVAVAMHIPWVLWVADALLTAQSRPRRASCGIGIALLFGSQCLLGFPQFLWMTILAIGSHVVYRRCEDGGWGPVGWLCSSLVVGLLIGAAQLVPTLDVLSESTRMGRLPGFSMSLSLHPFNLVQLWSPWIYASRIYAQPDQFVIHEFALYNGAFCTVAIAWVAARWRGLQRKTLATVALAIAALNLLLALGRYGGVYWLVSQIPGLGHLRAPTRHIVLVHFAMALLSAIAIDDLIAASRQRATGRPRLWLIMIPGTASLMTLLAVSPVSTSEWLAPYGVSLSPLIIAGAGASLIVLTSALCVLAARGHVWALLALAVLTTVDLGVWGWPYAWRQRPAAPAALMPAAGIPAGAMTGEALRPAFPPADINQFVLHGFRLANGYAGLSPRLTLDPDDPQTLRLGGVRWVQRADGWKRLSDSLPRARLVSDARVSDDVRADLHRVDVARTALIEPPPLDVRAPPGEAWVLMDRPGRILVHTSAPAAQLLVLTERFHAGWRVEEDGRAVPARRAYGDYLSCVVSPGQHRIWLTFSPASARTGILLSLVGLGLCLGARLRLR